MSFTFEQECLDAHNKYRQLHQVPPLVLNKLLSAECKKFAQELVHEQQLRRGEVKDLGENVYCVTSTNPDVTISGNKAVDSWYEKSVDYDYSQEPSGNNQSLSFTQMVWKGSEELGVGHAKLKGKIVVVTRYSPQGNVRTCFTNNVFPPTTSNLPKQHLTCTMQNKPVVLKGNERENNPTFNEACLKAHNNYRAKHGVAPLILDQDMCNFSQEWANELANRGKLEHRPNEDYGENIFSAWSSDPNYTIDGEKAVNTWYDEIKLHKFGVEPTDLKTGHFTQVVWKASQKLGVGFAKKNGSVYVVCNYSPPGNYVGNYVANVPAPL